MAKGEYQIFNPDFEISGNHDSGWLKLAVRAEMGREDFDAEKDCPYDRTLCRQKLVRIHNWAAAVEYMAENRLNNTFCTSGDMFHGCPVPHLNCVRRMRYLGLIQHFSEMQRQK